MSIYKTGKRKYYKYESWTQPVNPSGITATSGWGNPKNAFDGSDGTYATCGTTSDYIEWDLGTDILLSGITANGQHVTNTAWASNITVKSVDSSGKETTLGTTTGTTTGAYTVRCTFSETKVNRLRFYLARNDQGSNPSTSTKTRIKEIKLTATQQVVEATADDYAYSVVETDKIKDVYKSTERKYYKYGTELNATVNGTFAKIDKGVASGFSTSQYLKFPELFRPENNTWEMVFKITTGSNLTTAQYIMALGKGFTEATRYATRIGIHEDKNFVISVSYNGTAWDIVGGSTAGAKGSHTVLPNTTYYLKYEFTGGAYKLSYSLDGVDYIQDCYVESTTPMYNSNTANLIGVWNNGSYINPFLGSIDLSQSYININGERWWSGDVNKVGSWIDDGVVSGFTSANYLKIPQTFNPSSNSWEWNFKLTMGTDVSTTSYILGCTETSGSHGALLGMVSGKLRCWLSANGTSWNIVSDGTATTSLVSGETYYIKFGWTGSEYYIDLSTNGIDYNREYTLVSATTVHSSAFNICNAWSVNYPFKGSTDLNQSYIKINGKEWWHGTKAIEINVNGPDTYQDWTQPVLTANGVLGGDGFAVASNVAQYSGQGVYKLFDDSTSGCFHSTSGVTTGYIDLYNPEPLKITNILVNNQNASSSENRASTSGNIYGSSNGSDWEQITSYTNTVQGINEQWNIDLSSNNKAYKYYRIESTAGGTSGYWTIGELTITAQELVAVGGTVEDADYSLVPAKQIVAAYKTGKRKYYKLQDFVQPILTANGTMGGDSFAVNASSYYDEPRQAFNAFDGENGDTAFCWHSTQGFPQWISWYNPNPLKTTNVKVTNRTLSGSYPNAYQLQYSDDNATWTTAVSGNGTSGNSVSWDIPVTHDTPHKYWRLYVTSASGSNNSYLAIGEIDITAQEAIEVPVENITDWGSYKYYKDVVTTKYWKEITTGSKELGYACYKTDNYESYWYAKAPVGSDKTKYYVNDNGDKANNPSELKSGGTLSRVTENEAVMSLGGGFGELVYKRYKDGDLYIDTTVTETVEGTPEDYTYTTEEIVKTEVSADEDYDYTEFVLSTQFDSSEISTQLVYNLVKSYLKASDWNAVKESANTGVWGSDGSQYSIYSGTTTDNFTFKELQPAGKWTLTFAASQQYNFRYGTFKITITYEDGTQGVVWNSNSIFPNGADAGGDYTIALTMEKKWKSISIYMATARAGENYCYGGHGKNRLTFYGNKQ